MYGVTRLDEIRNDCIGENLGVTNIGENLRENKLRWFGRVGRRNKENIVKRIGEIIVKRNREKCKSKKK